MVKITRLVAVVVAGVAAVSIGWGTTSLSGTTPDGGDRIAFGMIGIVEGQVAKVTAVYLPPVNDSRQRTPDWCGTLMFLDGNGEVVAEQASRLMPGQSASLDFPFERRGSAIDGSRQQIRAMIIDGCVDDPNIKTKGGAVVGSVEVFDAETGRSQFVLPASTVAGPSPHM